MTVSTLQGRALRLVLAGLLAMAGVVLLGGPASAHASLVSTDPAEGSVLEASPGSATFTFDEPVRLPGPSVRTFDADGEEVESSARTTGATLEVDLPDTLADGTYVVTWRVISTDGHPIAGALTFSVGEPSERVVPPDAEAGAGAGTDAAVVQGLTYLGTLGAAGLVAFLLLLLPASARTPEVRRRLLPVVTALVCAATVGAFLHVPLSALYQQGRGLSGITEGDTWFGDLDRPEWLAVLVVAGGLVTARVAAARRHRLLGMAGAVLALSSLALVGHTRSVDPTWLVFGADLLHVGTAATWFGGLAGLSLVLRLLPAEVGARTLARFSTVAAALVGLVAVTGIALGWRILGGFGPLAATTYGRLLLVKAGLVLLALAVAWWNRYRLLPRVAGAGAGPLSRAVRLEAAGLVVVLALTGFLVQQSPNDDSGVALPGRDALTHTALSRGVRVYAVVDPGIVGPNEVLVQVQDQAGEPLEPFAEPVLTAALGDLRLGEQPLTGVGSGTYTSTVVLPRPGDWRLSLSVRLSEFDSPVVAVDVPVRARGR